MKNYINQFYNEGFATTFYLKPLNYLKKTISDKHMYLIISKILKVIYTVLVLLFAIFILIYKLPF